MHHFRWLTKLFQVGCEATYSHLYACLEDKTWGKEFNVILQQYAISTCYWCTISNGGFAVVWVWA